MKHEYIDLFECVPDLALVLIIESAIITILYFLIAFNRFLPAAHAAASEASKQAWYSIFILFPSCGICAYATTVLAGWYPEIAYPIKASLMLIGIVCCFVFYIKTKDMALILEDSAEKLDKAQNILNDSKLSEREIITLLKNSLASNA